MASKGTEPETPPNHPACNPLTGKGFDGERGAEKEPDGNGRYWIRTSDFHRVRMAL